MGNLSHTFDIHDIETGIAHHFTKQQLGIWLDCGLDTIRVCCRDKTGFNTKAGQGIFQQIHIRPIKLGGGHDVIA